MLAPVTSARGSHDRGPANTEIARGRSTTARGPGDTTWRRRPCRTRRSPSDRQARRSPSDRQARRSPSDRQARRDDPHPIVRRGDPHPIVKGTRPPSRRDDPHPIVKGTQPPRRARRSPSDRHAPIVTRPSARRWCPPGPCSDSARAGDLGAWVERPGLGEHRDRPGALRNCARPRGDTTWRRRPCQSRDAPPSHRPPRRSPSDRHRHPTVRRGPSRRRPRLNQDQPLNTWVGSVLVTPWGAASVAARRSPSDRQARRSPSDRQARRSPSDRRPCPSRDAPHPIVRHIRSSGGTIPIRSSGTPSDRQAHPIVRIRSSGAINAGRHSGAGGGRAAWCRQVPRRQVGLPLGRAQLRSAPGRSRCPPTHGRSTHAPRSPARALSEHGPGGHHRPRRGASPARPRPTHTRRSGPFWVGAPAHARGRSLRRRGPEKGNSPLR